MVLLWELGKEMFGQIDLNLEEEFRTMGQIMDSRGRHKWLKESASPIFRWAIGCPLRVFAVLGASLSSPRRIRSLYKIRSVSDDLYYRPHSEKAPLEKGKTYLSSIPTYPQEYAPPPGRYNDVMAYPLFVAEEL